MTKEQAKQKRTEWEGKGPAPFDEDWWDKEIERAVGLGRDFVMVDADDILAVAFFKSKKFKVTAESDSDKVFGHRVEF